MMKKIVTMVLCLILVLIITACGANTNKSETSTDDKTTGIVADYANIKSSESF